MEKEKTFIQCYIIVNDCLKYSAISLDKVIIRNNLLYFDDDYGMGSIHWPIISSPKKAFKRQLKENILWATGRLEWARKNSPKEIDELLDIINSNGYTRNQKRLEIFKQYLDLKE